MLSTAVRSSCMTIIAFASPGGNIRVFLESFFKKIAKGA